MFCVNSYNFGFVYNLLLSNSKKNPANTVLATLACSSVAHLMYVLLEHKNPIELNIVYKIVNLSRM